MNCVRRNWMTCVRGPWTDHKKTFITSMAATRLEIHRSDLIHRHNWREFDSADLFAHYNCTAVIHDVIDWMNDAELWWRKITAAHTQRVPLYSNELVILYDFRFPFFYRLKRICGNWTTNERDGWTDVGCSPRNKLCILIWTIACATIKKTKMK